jgi:hypothetical protein
MRLRRGRVNRKVKKSSKFEHEDTLVLIRHGRRCYPRLQKSVQKRGRVTARIHTHPLPHQTMVRKNYRDVYRKGV